VAGNDFVVAGMKHNPFPARARKALEAIGQPFKYPDSRDGFQAASNFLIT